LSTAGLFDKAPGDNAGTVVTPPRDDLSTLCFPKALLMAG
jgi:hypothetical protein